MADATFAVGSFLGGEISQFAQGRFDKPDYRYSLKVCLNAFPSEIGTWVRRPGSFYAGHTRGGLPGRKIKFDFEQASAVTVEFTDSTIRFRSGAVLLDANDSQVVSALLQSTGTYGVTSMGNGGRTIGTAGIGNGGFQFTAPATGTIQQINIDIVAGGGSGTWKAQLWSNSSGHPGAQIGSDSASVAGIGVAAVKGQAFSFSSQPSVTAGTIYWIILVPVIEAALNIDTCNALAAFGSGRNDTITAIGAADLPSSEIWRMEIIYGAVSAPLSVTRAVVQTTSATTWATGNTLMFPGASTPLLENRQFTATQIDTTHFSLADAITGASIDGSTLGALVAGATVMRVQEVVSPYAGGSWASIRAVQAETTDIFLCGTVAPQALTVTTPPSAGVNPVFALGPATFNDGPYLDPFTNGATATPNQKTGIIQLTLSFPAYVSTTAYPVGAFVTSSSVNYVSLVDQNVGNTPASSPSQWAVTSASAAINNGKGFLGTDVGRLVRLFSEPLAWAAGNTYSQGNIVSYNPSGTPGATTYWQSLTGSNTGNAPGADLTNWELLASGAAIWTWGKITSLLNIISRSLAGSVNIGGMTQGGGLAAAFDGIISKQAGACAEQVDSGSGSAFNQLTAFVGKNYSGASAQKIGSATVFPSTDFGFGGGTSVGGSITVNNVTINLRAKQTSPANSGDGTLLGTTGELTGALTRPVTIISSDTSTAWNYVWFEVILKYTAHNTISYNLIFAIAQAQFFSPSTSGTGDGVNVELLGPPLLYNNPISTWRLGVYSNTTGWPTCGVYNDGRLYLGGAVGNRFDASVSNGIVGGTINFAPTDQFGVVTANSAISYTFNSKGVNQILWMKPDLQGLKAGTKAGEWLVQAPTAGSISPLNISARQVTSHGSANIEPADTEHTLVFVQRFSQKLLEYFPDVFSGKFSAPNLADKAQHITRAGIAELAYTSAVTPIIWGRDALGALLGITYKRDSLASAQPPTFYGWHRHALGSGRVVESICAGPSVGGDLDALTMVTNDLTTNIRHVEVLTDTPDEQTALVDCQFLDDAVNPTSVSSTVNGLTINGLWHLNGKTVQVFAGGLDCGDPGEDKPYSDFTVANGSVFVPYGDSISAGAGRGLFTQAFAAALPLSQILVGFTYNSDGQLVKPIAQGDSGARNGPAFGKLTRAHRYAMKLVNTLGISIGGTFGLLRAANLRKTPAQPVPVLTPFSGIAQDALQDDYFHDGGVCWRVSRPFPANVVAIGLNLETMDQ